MNAGSWTYDAHGRTRSFTDSSGASEESTYNYLGDRAIKRSYSAGGRLQSETLYFGQTVEVRDGQLRRWVVLGGARVAEVPAELPKKGYTEVPIAQMALALLALIALLRTQFSSVRVRPTRRELAPLAACLVAGLMLVGACRDRGGSEGGELEITKQTQFYVEDRIGSSSLVLDHEGEVVGRTGTTPFGSAWFDHAESGVHHNPYEFTGKERDEVSGGLHFGARVYLPELGRFTTPDWAFLLEGASGGLETPRFRNPYTYARNNPMMHVDPDGQWDWESVKSDALAYGSQAVDAANNVVSGATDEASMGATRWVRDKAGLGDTVNYDGAAYKAAQKTVEYGGYATGAVGLGLAIRKMGVKTFFKGAVHSADDAVELAAKKASKKRPPKPSCPIPGSPCFVAGTHVETDDGPVEIEDIAVGDWVWAADPETGVEGPRRVLSLFRTPDVPVLQVTVETELSREVDLIETTAEHPFWVEDRGWIKGGELQQGDQLRDIDGGTLLVRAIEETQRRETVFNLEVEGVHTYFAGRLGVLVHNSCPSTPDPPKPPNRGRLQAQGAGVEESVSWARATPPSLAEGKQMLEELAGKLTRSQKKARSGPIEKAGEYLDRCAKCGGADGPVSKSFYRQKGSDVRVDVEIKAGKAFTPN